MLLKGFFNLHYKIRRVPALQVEVPHFHVCRQLHTLWHCVNSPGQTLKLTSYRYYFHPYHHPHYHHFMHCLGQFMVSNLFFHTTTHISTSPTPWTLSLWICEIYGLSWEYSLFFLLHILITKASIYIYLFTLLTMYLNMPRICFKYAHYYVTLSLLQCFPTMTLKGEKIWNQIQLCVKVSRYKRKLENGCITPFFFMAKYGNRSGLWAVLLRVTWGLCRACGLLPAKGDIANVSSHGKDTQILLPWSPCAWETVGANIKISDAHAPSSGRMFSDWPFQWEIGLSDKNQAFIDATTFLQFSTVSISSVCLFVLF